jgi:hypothetical protein
VAAVVEEAVAAAEVAAVFHLAQAAEVVEAEVAVHLLQMQTVVAAAVAERHHFEFQSFH